MKIQKGQKIFVSSTSYDLIDVRAELLDALRRWGFKALGHEDPGFPIPFNMHSHDVCIEAVKQCDIIIIVIDARYGNPYSGCNTAYIGKNWSITRCEADVAFKEKKGIYTYVRDTTWNERKLYNDFVKSGKPSKDFVSSYVSDAEIFEFINEITRRENSNWIHNFRNSVELKAHLKRLLTEETTDIFNLDYFKIYDNEN